MLWWTLRQLKSKNPEKRRLAVNKLRESGYADSVTALIDALKDSDKTVRYAAREALEEVGEVGDERAVQPLIEGLKDADPLVRSTVADVLGEIGDLRAVKPLMAAMEHSDDYLSSFKNPFAEALVKIGPAAVEPLIAALKDLTSKVRGSAMAPLGRLGDLRAVGLLITVVEDAEALRAVSYWPTDKIMELLSAALSATCEVSHQAKSLLIRAGARVLSDRDRKLGGHPDRLQERIMTLLVEEGGTEGMKALVYMARNTSHGKYLTPEIMHALVESGNPAALEFLLNLSQLLVHGALDLAWAENVVIRAIATLEGIHTRPTLLTPPAKSFRKRLKPASAVAQAIVALKNRQMTIRAENSAQRTKFAVSDDICTHGPNGWRQSGCRICERYREMEPYNACPKCRSSNAYFAGSTPRSMGGDGLTAYECRECGHRWRR